MAIPLFLARRIGEKYLDQDFKDRLKRLHFRDAGHGYDAFGLHPDIVIYGAAITKWLYEKYFRVISIDSHHIPSEGAAIMAINHSGTIPVDGMMIWHDVLRQTDPPRCLRGIADHFVPALPVIGATFARGGIVGGSRGNVRALLNAGELLMIFPEGTPGIIKPFKDRYKLRDFRVGHAELAIAHQVPIVPVGIVGAEEQLPSLFSSKVLGNLMGLGSVPIPLTPIPLPVRYRIIYGEPIDVASLYRPEQADDPDVVSSLAAIVQAGVSSLIKRGLSERTGVFK